MSLEYTYLLTSQLESQRMYYEDHLESLTAQLSTLSSQVKTLAGEVQLVRAENDSLVSHSRQTEKMMKEVEKEKEKTERKLETVREKCDNLRKDWQEEKEVGRTFQRGMNCRIASKSVRNLQMATSLIKNNEHLKEDNKTKEQTIADLSDQVRDLMFFLESREKIQDNPELEGGSVEVGPTMKGKKARRGKR